MTQARYFHKVYAITSHKSQGSEWHTLQKAEVKLKQNKIKRDADFALNASCLTCTYTKTALGKKLHCLQRDKLVNQYNYCESWKELEPKKLAEEALKWSRKK